MDKGRAGLTILLGQPFLHHDTERETYTPLSVLDHRSLGYDYDHLDPTGFQTGIT